MTIRHGQIQEASASGFQVTDRTMRLGWHVRRITRWESYFDFENDMAPAKLAVGSWFNELFGNVLMRKSPKTRGYYEYHAFPSHSRGNWKTMKLGVK